MLKDVLREIDNLIGKISAKCRVLESQDSLSRDQVTELDQLKQDHKRLHAARAVIARHGIARNYHPRRDQFGPNSATSTVIQIISEADQPLATSEILRRASAMGRPLRRSSVTPRIAKLAKAGRVFKWYAPGVYGLIEWRKERAGLIAAQSITDGLANLRKACAPNQGDEMT